MVSGEWCRLLLEAVASCMDSCCFATPSHDLARRQIRPLTTHHSPLTTHHSPLTTHHSPLTTHHSPLPTHHSPPTPHPPPPPTHHSRIQHPRNRLANIPHIPLIHRGHADPPALHDIDAEFVAQPARLVGR